MAQEKTLDEEQGRAAQPELSLIAPDKMDEYSEAWNASVLRHELDLIPDTEFATALGLAPQTLAAWRSEGQGPAFVKLGKSVFYRRELIKEWIGRNITPMKEAA